MSAIPRGGLSRQLRLGIRRRLRGSTRAVRSIERRGREYRSGATTAVLPAGRKRIEDLVETYLTAIRSGGIDNTKAAELFSEIGGGKRVKTVDIARACAVPEPFQGRLQRAEKSGKPH